MDRMDEWMMNERKQSTTNWIFESFCFWKFWTHDAMTFETYLDSRRDEMII